MADAAENMNDPATRSRQGVYGRTWPGPHLLRPALVTAMYAVSRPMRPRRHVHVRWVIDYNFDPMSSVRVGPGEGGCWPRREPCVHLYAPLTPYHETPAQPGRRLRSAYLMLEHGEAARLPELLGPWGAAQFADPQGLVGRWLLEAADAGRRGEAGRFAAHAAMLHLIDLLHRARRTEPGRYVIDADAEPAAFAQRVEQFLVAHLRQRVRLRDVARHLSISESSLSHRYRQATGASPMARLLELRINLAKGLLLRGEPLKTAAAATGFADAFHLSRTFKRIEGVSPRAWLKR